MWSVGLVTAQSCSNGLSELVFDKIFRMCYFVLHILGDFCNSEVKEYSVIIGQALDNFCVSRKKS